MPYAREVLLRSDAIGCEHLTLLQGGTGWSDEYRVDGSKLVLMLHSPLDCRVGGQAWRCDPALGLWLSPEVPYRMRQPQSGQGSLVIALPGIAVRPGRVAVAPAAWLALRSWRRTVRNVETLAAEEALVHAVAPLLPVPAPRPPHAAVERAIAWLGAHFTRNDPLAAIGREAGCSPFHLARQFRRVTGRSLHAHRTHLRIAEALRRLDEGEQDLTALALDLGFSSHSHFTQVFRTHCGAQPRAVRTNLAAACQPPGDTARPWLHPSPASSRASRRR